MKNKSRYILIMAGGVGSRFWPASRECLPKQFLDILGTGKTLIQQTYERCLKIVSKENILIATHENYADLVLQQLTEIERKQIVTEPSRNNTAPCIAYAALKIKSLDENASFAVLPSDHIIIKEETFVEKMDIAFGYAAQNDALVTLGIKPSRPDTGYGYIELDDPHIASKSSMGAIVAVKQFREKPDRETAVKYFQDGKYLWNAGIFIWSVQSIIKAFHKHTPKIIEILSLDIDQFNGPNEAEYIHKVYPQTPRISVDFAIMEPANNIFTIPTDIGWSDLGTWNSLYNFLDKDESGNVVQSEEIRIQETTGSFIRASKDKMLVIKGLTDYIVIDDKDVLLIFPRNEEQQIKALKESITKDQYL